MSVWERLRKINANFSLRKLFFYFYVLLFGKIHFSDWLAQKPRDFCQPINDRVFVGIDSMIDKLFSFELLILYI